MLLTTQFCACWCVCGVPRVMGDAVLLADGNLLIINGAQRGFQGLTNRGGYGRDPQLQPLIYNTGNYS